MIKHENIAVYISSFDGYSDLWDTFFNIFESFWQNCPYPIYLVDNEKEYCRDNIILIKTGEEVDWFTRTIKSLKRIKEEYIIFMLEDYYISKSINANDFDDIIHYMKKNNIYFYMLSLVREIRKKEISQHCVRVKKSRVYPINLQPAIWKTSKFLEILEEINGKTPWDFEYYYNEFYNSSKEFIKGIRYDTRDLLGYKNGVLRGKWIPSTLEYYSNLGIDIDIGERKKMSKQQEIKYAIASWVCRCFDYKTKKIVKNILDKLHVPYL